MKYLTYMEFMYFIYKHGIYVCDVLVFLKWWTICKITLLFILISYHANYVTLFLLSPSSKVGISMHKVVTYMEFMYVMCKSWSS
jgi:hypothetical protein